MWSHGLCKNCHRKAHPEKYQIKRSPIKSKIVDDDSGKEREGGIRRTRPKPISDKLKAELKKYKVLRNEYLKENPVCEFEGCSCLASDLHHKAGRGVNLNNVGTFMSLCREHHRYIHENDEWARERGYIWDRLAKK